MILANRLQNITSSVDEADADILLKLAQDCGSSILTSKMNLVVPSILNEVNALNNGVTGITNKLKDVVPVCNFLVI